MCLLQYVREVSDPLGQPAAVRLGLRACRSQTIRSLYKLYLYNVPRELPVPGRQRGGEWGRSREKELEPRDSRATYVETKVARRTCVTLTFT